MPEQIAIVGAGLIGRSWAIVFARAGHIVRMWDHDPAVMPAALPRIVDALTMLKSFELIDEEPVRIAARIQGVSTLEEALHGAGYVQENTAERVEVKREIFERMDALASPECVLASSTSTIPASSFSEHLTGRHRCIVAHPVNPPHLVPVVEIAPAPWTAADIVAQTRALHERAGQVPVHVRTEVRGFIVNRLQAALLMEAWRLIESGRCSVDDLDKCVRDGLGLRWSFMGPFETIDLNAPGGVADYANRYGPPMHEALTGERTQPWGSAVVSQVEAERRALLPAENHDEREAWRDRRLMALVAHKKGLR